eukprot:g131.t1 g131   contig1:317008-318866(-)
MDQSSDSTLDGIHSIRTYIDRLITGDNRCHGMKVLLLDSTTTQIVACVSTQSEILSREVYLVERLDDPKSSNSSSSNNSGGGGRHSLALTEESTTHTSHMKAVAFLRPTEVNIGLLVRELSHPRFSEYHIFFSGILPSNLLQLLAENDALERVRQVQEFYADFLPINDDLLSLNCRNTLPMTVSSGSSSSRDHTPLYHRNVMGLQSMLLAMKRQPSLIRYQKSSQMARQLALDINESIRSDQIFHFRRGSGGYNPSSSSSGTNNNLVLLVLDRMDDPVTPLLSQWTYQAMVHELLGLNNNRVILRGVPNVSKDLEEVVLSSAPGVDSFFGKHRNSNFGYAAFYGEVSRVTESESYGVKARGDYGELARLVEVCSLMDVSAFEQDLACVDDQVGHLKELMSKLDSSMIKIPDKLRLGMLYALRYENVTSNNAIPAVKEAMKRGGVPPSNVALVDAILKYAGSKVRGPGLYGTNKDTFSKMTKSFFSTVQGVSNVYSQHSPVLMDTVEGLVKGKLRGETHPLVLSGGGTSSSVENLPLPQEVLIFMVGGVTYEEATKVNEFNRANAGRVRVVLGGSTVHNSTSFLEELKLI